MNFIKHAIASGRRPRKYDLMQTAYDCKMQSYAGCSQTLE